MKRASESRRKRIHAQWGPSQTRESILRETKGEAEAFQSKPLQKSLIIKGVTLGRYCIEGFSGLLCQ